MAGIQVFRSEEMVYMQAIVPEEAGRPFIDSLACLGCAQLTDLNGDMNAFQRRFMKDIVRIQDLDRKMTAIENNLTTYGIQYPKLDLNDRKIGDRCAFPPDALDAIENQIGNYFSDIADNVRVVTELEASVSQAKEFALVLAETGKMLSHRNEARAELEDMRMHAEVNDSFHIHNEMNVPMLQIDSESNSNSVGLSYLAGVVSRSMRPTLERQTFLVARGNTLNLFSEVSVNGGGGNAEQELFPFIIFFLGAQLRKRLTRLCESLNVRLYIYPESSENLELQQHQAEQQVEQLSKVNSQSVAQLNSLLADVGARFSSWNLFLIQEKTLLFNMNKLRIQGPTMIAQFWIPSADLPRVQHALDRAATSKGLASSLTSLECDTITPTYFRENGFTDVFQTIVNTYGVPRYGEVNPALFTIITFPFLFGIMFGDIGHGGALLLAGLALVLLGEKLLKMDSNGDNFYSQLYRIRFLLFFMGFFACYMGWIYNDCFSLSIDMGSSYEFREVFLNVSKSADNYVIVNETMGIRNGDSVYPFGVDPIWSGSGQLLQFDNSLKMKMAVIVGVIQMLFGIFLSVCNHVHFKNYLSIYSEFIPQFIFMMSLFGYMVFMIIIKWCTDWSIVRVNGMTLVDGKEVPCLISAPNLITTMINMFLKIGTIECSDLLYEGQGQVQTVLVMLAGISMPWMLIMKPLILYFRLPKSNPEHEHSLLADHDSHDSFHDMKEHDHDEHVALKVESKSAHGEHAHGDFSEIVIHQMIHTIEYILGTISNTASYLRLWALSLAHAELSEVFWEKVLVASWNTGSPIFVVVGFAMWLAATIGVLMCMDVLECFLHALRLHWVEFQNKFYSADGVAFQPFSYYLAVIEDHDK